MSEEESSEEEDALAREHQGDEDDTNAIQQVGEFVSMILNTVSSSDESVAGPSSSSSTSAASSSGSTSSDASTSRVANAADLAVRWACRPISRRRSSQEPSEPLPPIECFPTPPETRSQPRCDPETCPNSIRKLLCETSSLLSYYQRCLRLIETSNRSDFSEWEWLDNCMHKMSQHPSVSNKMKLRYFMINKDNTRTFRLIQRNFQLNLDEQFYMGKMNLLHIACDSGWANLARELVMVEGMDVNLPCPSEHMRPGNLTPLMLASGAGHRDVVEVLLQRGDLNLDQRDKEGFTALFHACNHGTNRVGDQHGYFRRLWSWDLSQEKLNQMETIARSNAREILRLLISHGSDIDLRDNSGASILCRASAVDNFSSVLRFLVEVGCKPSHNVLNWTRVKNPGCLDLIESHLRTPRSLVSQSRITIWRSLRRAAGAGSSRVRTGFFQSRTGSSQAHTGSFLAGTASSQTRSGSSQEENASSKAGAGSSQARTGSSHAETDSSQTMPCSSQKENATLKAETGSSQTMLDSSAGSSKAGGGSFKARLRHLGGDNGLPTLLIDYLNLNCR